MYTNLRTSFHGIIGILTLAPPTFAKLHAQACNVEARKSSQLATFHANYLVTMSNLCTVMFLLKKAKS